MLTPDFVKKDPFLEPHKYKIVSRLRKAYQKEKELTGEGKLGDFANGYNYFGLHRTPEGWVLREWAPNASCIYLIGDFTQWKLEESYKLQPIGNGNWELNLPDGAMKHQDLYKLFMCWEGGSGDRIPAWANRVVQDPVTHLWNAQVWSPDEEYQWKNALKYDKNFFPLIYEAHTGMATEEYKVGTWEEFRVNVLPHIEKAGYNTIQLMAVQEHPFYGSFGYHVNSFFAASSRFGTPEDLKALVDDAHGRGIRVIMDIVHSHAVKNEVEGISRYDGTYYQFFHDGPRGNHPAWDSRCFDYGKDSVLHFLLSNCKFWLEEYGFDGYRFDGVTSMLYLDHGLGTAFMSYDQYFNENQDEDAITYLYLANKLIHEIKPGAISVAEEMSGMPGLATSQALGGLGFDYRLAMGVPDYWIRTIKEQRIQFWHVSEMFNQLSNKRWDEKTIHYAESHDQALVGDKTIIFWLMDQDMYFNMRVDQQNLTIDNGMALHKMIRLITLATAGNGYLNFMGNEFGHPEWIDFPGRHNNWSYHHARRQWSLMKDPDLRYHLLNAFDQEMIGLIRKEKLLLYPEVNRLMEHVSDQILVIGRKELVFVFNFNPFDSYTDYPVKAPSGDYSMVLNTDNPRFGGFGRIDEKLVYSTHSDPNNQRLMLYIPALTSFVLKKKK
ncbi:MAG: alpha amylase C-terminal domain-containing protein [Bacteroides sp.]|jgi:1,4-alpha-glucan branching enzyme|nr:alpha amylase C-terminal domain-containing protein [Bacteroides sp.]